MQKVRLSSLSFDGLDLVFDVKVDNPNPISLGLAGFDYDFQLTGASFLQGRQDQAVTISAQGESVVPIPLRLEFAELYRTFVNLKDQDSTSYQMAVGFTFDIPVLGPTRVPLSVDGHLPMLKLPGISVGGLKIKKLNITGADLALQLQVQNPNGFDLGLNRLDYALAVSGKAWATGNSTQLLNVAQKGTQTLDIPISLDFAQIGLGVFQILSGRESLDYSLTGGLDLSTSLPLFPQANLPLDQAGKLQILR